MRKNLLFLYLVYALAFGLIITCGGKSDSDSDSSPSPGVLSINASNITFNEGGDFAVLGANMPVTWASSNPIVGRVTYNELDNTYKVLAGIKGDAIITATTLDGTQTEICTVTVNDTLIMQTIPAATGSGFIMGGNDGEENSKGSERPRHYVPLSSFFMGKYTVTQAFYEAVMEDNPSAFGDGETDYLTEPELVEKRPVECVSWYHAIAFCNRLSILEGRTPLCRATWYTVLERT